MHRYLVDNNLPRHLAQWATTNFEYVRDIDPAWSDWAIWLHAQSNDLTVLTKDTDFMPWALMSTGPARLVHFRVGNMRLGEFRALVNRDWVTIEQLLATHRVIAVYPTRLEATS
jgi:predicted nuclease of predicted toxin-antitoxin system